VFVSELIAITGIRDHHRLEHLIAIPGIRSAGPLCPISDARRRLREGFVLCRKPQGSALCSLDHSRIAQHALAIRLYGRKQGNGGTQALGHPCDQLESRSGTPGRLFSLRGVLFILGSYD
jgi:hypothetical protein